jgi:hypothetical protein
MMQRPHLQICGKIENKLIKEYLDLHAHKYAQDKCGVGWIFMEKKCLKFAKGLGLNDSICMVKAMM